MPTVWIYVLLLPPTILLARDDFRTRSISVVWLAVLIAAAAAVGWTTVGLRPMLLHAICNVGVLLLFAGAMLLWELLRRRPLREFFTRSFGLGDAAMMFTTVPVFETGDYVRFLLVSGIAALGWWGVKRPATIPLAGFMALTLAGYAILKIAGLWS